MEDRLLFSLARVLIILLDCLLSKLSTDLSIGAYIIGGEISKSWLKKMEDIYICDGPTELGCLVHWDTINVTLINKDMPRFNICVNQ